MDVKGKTDMPDRETEITKKALRIIIAALTAAFKYAQ